MLLEIIKLKYEEYVSNAPKRVLPFKFWVILVLMIVFITISIVMVFLDMFKVLSIGIWNLLLPIISFAAFLITIPILTKSAKSYRKGIAKTEYKEWLDGSISFHNSIKEYISKGSYELLLSQITEEINQFDESNKKQRKIIGFFLGSVYMGVMLAIAPVLVDKLFEESTRELAQNGIILVLLPIILLALLYLFALLIEKMCEKDISLDIELQKRIRTLIELSENKYKTHMDKVVF